MKATVNKRKLHLALMNQMRIIPQKTLQSQCQNVLITAEKDRLTFCTTDLETSMVTVISENDCKVIQKGTVSVPVGFFINIIDKIEDEEVGLKFVPSSTLLVEWKNGNATLPTFDVSEFPQIRFAGEDAQEIEVNSGELNNAVGNVAYAVAKDLLRPAMNGVFFDINEDSLTLAASDATRLATATIKNIQSGIKVGFIIPEKAARCMGCYAATKEQMKIRIDSQSITFIGDEITFTTKPIAGKFPDYKKVIPQNNDKTLTIDRKALRETLNRMIICGDRTSKIVSINISTGLVDANVEVTAADEGFKTSAKETILASYTGDAIKIGMKAESLISIIGNFTAQSENVRITMSDPRKALVITPENQNEIECLAIMMPVRLL